MEVTSGNQNNAAPDLTATATNDKKKDLSTATISRQVITLTELPTHRDQLPLKENGTIWVVNDCSTLSTTIVEQLQQRGFNSELISPNHDIVPQQLVGLVIIAPQVGTDSQFLSDSFQLVQRCGAALKNHGADEASCLVTVSRLDGKCGFGGETTIIDPLSGGLAGISKTASHEWSEVNCKAVDLGADLSETAQAESVIDELLHADPLEVGINASGRCTLALQEKNLATDSPALHLTAEDVVIISGGARGVTAEVANAMANSGQPTLLLLGRSPLPEPEQNWLLAAHDEAAIKKALMTHAAQPLKPRELNNACSKVLNNRELTHNIQRLQQAGSKVIYRSVDIRDEQAVASAVTEARDLGNIRGFIHGAGVLADRKIEDKTPEQFEMVYSTKINGLQALIQATYNDNLDFIALFSSSTGRFGRSGQVDYAVANEVLNKSAQALTRQRKSCRIVSFNWGPWDGGMVTPALKKIFAAEGIGVIDLQVGSHYLLQELAHNDNEVEVVILGGTEQTPAKNDKSDEHNNGDNNGKKKPVSNVYSDKVFDLHLNSNNMPVLHHHVINNKAVVPMALLVEWLAQGALHNNPGLIFYGFDNLRILNGIKLAANNDTAIGLRYGGTSVEDGTFIIPMQIYNETDQTIHASADIILSSALPDQRPAIDPLVVDGAEMATQGEIYSAGQLFHGPLLQGLKQVIGNNTEGIIALSSNAPPPAKWMENPLRNTWVADPQLLDSAFQMMILWSFAQKHLGSLPNFAAQYRQYCEQFPSGTTRIQCRVTKTSQNSASANIDFIDERTRQLLARLEGYECTMTENLHQAFVNNQL